MDAFFGEIRAFGFNYAPVNWAMCNGDKLSIQQYSTLFAILGELYGPTDFRTYFTLPDLRGQAPMGAGNPPAASGGPTSIPVGKHLGEESISLSVNQIPPHTHQVTGGVVAATAMTPAPASNSLLSRPVLQSGPTVYWSLSNQDSPDKVMSPAMIQPAGQSQPHNNMQPFLALNFCICLQGEWPPKP